MSISIYQLILLWYAGKKDAKTSLVPDINPDERISMFLAYMTSDYSKTCDKFVHRARRIHRLICAIGKQYEKSQNVIHALNEEIQKKEHETADISAQIEAENKILNEVLQQERDAADGVKPASFGTPKDFKNAINHCRSNIDKLEKQKEILSSAKDLLSEKLNNTIHDNKTEFAALVHKFDFYLNKLCRKTDLLYEEYNKRINLYWYFFENASGVGKHFSFKELCRISDVVIRQKANTLCEERERINNLSQNMGLDTRV